MATYKLYKIPTDLYSSEMAEIKAQIIVTSLLFIMPIIGMAVDLVAPSLPAIASDLNISAGIAKTVISIYLLGYALGNFFAGFLTDAWGRKQLLRWGLTAFAVFSLLPVFFPKIGVVLTVRCLQGLTMGIVSVVTRAVFSDVLPPAKLVKLAPLLATMWGIGPIVGPVIGGYLQVYFGWQAGFCFFAAVTFTLAIIVFIVLPETHLHRHSLNYPTIKTHFVSVISHQFFIALAMLMGLSYSLLIVFNTAGPFLIQNRFHYSPVFFGHIALVLGVIFLISSLVCRQILKFFKIELIQLFSINLFFLIALVLVICSYCFPQSLNLVAIGSGFMFFGCGIIFPIAMGKGSSLFRPIAGTATAIMFLINIAITSLASFLLSFMNTQSTIALMWVYFILMLLCALVYWTMVHNSSSTIPSPLKVRG